MSITDELRAWAKEHLSRSSILAIADRIDAEHRAALEKLAASVDEDRDGWIELPCDADGVPIRVGDKVYQMGGGWVYTVKSITFYLNNTTVSFECEHGFGCDNAHSFRHYHEPTVEDVLREFTHAILNQKACYREQNIAEYAAKLRLADDGEDQQ